MSKKTASFELISKDGYVFGPYSSRQAAADDARKFWPGQTQADDEHDGWDIQVVGSSD